MTAPKMTDTNLRNVVAAIGLVMLGVGCWMVLPALGLIVPGIFMFATAIYGASRRT